MVSRKPIRRTNITGKKAVYITQYRNAALEVQKMYERKGEKAEIEAEHDASGAPVFVVYVYPKNSP
ncbi:MAG: hypothetical protein N3E51_04250 [Candidatus Micrarchaeota archaeon]|nr:hypothetical protein [Candidatus Micrarchaeota archaeon]